MSRTPLIVCYAVMLSRPRNALVMKRQAVSRFVASPPAVWRDLPGVLAALAAPLIHAREGQGETLTVPVAAAENGVSFARWDRASQGSVMAGAKQTSSGAALGNPKHKVAPPRPQGRGHAGRTTTESHRTWLLDTRNPLRVCTSTLGRN